MKLQKYLNERYVNLIGDKREEYVDDVWQILQDSYKSIGGIKGSGFATKESMLKLIPFWKVVRKNDIIIAVMLYKDKQGRKMITLGTNGTKEGKVELKRMIKDDVSLGRGYGEVSGPVLAVIKKMFTEKELEEFFVPSDTAIDVLNKTSKGAVPVDKFSYARKIGGTTIIKSMYGKIGKYLPTDI